MALAARRAVGVADLAAEVGTAQSLQSSISFSESAITEAPAQATVEPVHI